MSEYRNFSSNAADQRLTLFKSRPDVQRFTARYADWLAQGEGSIVNVQLSGLAMMRLAGRISWQEYRASVRNLASNSRLPPKDFQLLAEFSRELARCVLSSFGQIPFAPEQWDNEEGGADFAG